MTDDAVEKASPITKRVKDLNEQVEKLNEVIVKMAHYTGCNRILIEFGLDTWTPGQKDMTKYKG